MYGKVYTLIGEVIRHTPTNVFTYFVKYMVGLWFIRVAQKSFAATFVFEKDT